MTQKEHIPFNKQDKFIQEYIQQQYYALHDHLWSFLGEKDRERNPSFEVAIFYGAQLAAVDAEINDIGHRAYWMNTPGHEDAKADVENELPKLFDQQKAIFQELIEVSTDNVGYTVFDDAMVARGYLMATRRQPLGGEPYLAIAGYAREQALQLSSIEYYQEKYPTASVFQK